MATEKMDAKLNGKVALVTVEARLGINIGGTGFDETETARLRSRLAT